MKGELELGVGEQECAHSFHSFQRAWTLFQSARDTTASYYLKLVLDSVFGPEDRSK